MTTEQAQGHATGRSPAADAAARGRGAGAIDARHGQVMTPEFLKDKDWPVGAVLQGRLVDSNVRETANTETGELEDLRALIFADAQLFGADGKLMSDYSKVRLNVWENAGLYQSLLNAGLFADGKTRAVKDTRFVFSIVREAKQDLGGGRTVNSYTIIAGQRYSAKSK